MNQVLHKKPSADLDVTVKIDAVKVTGTDFLKECFKRLLGYRRVYDCLISGSSKDKVYERACQFINDENGQKLCIAYQPVNKWMPPVVVTIAPPDRTGMRRAELERILGVLPEFRLLKVEVAHDFCSSSVVDADFARRHLLVGKSWRSEDSVHGDMLYFGTRRSPVFCRCYWKTEIDSFRIELEVHSEWLQKNGIATPDDFAKFPDLVARKHVAFYKIDPLKLTLALQRLGVPVESTLRKVASRQHDLSLALRYLRSKVGLTNTRRILVSLKTNMRVEKALRLWARDWEQQGQVADEVE